MIFNSFAIMKPEAFSEEVDSVKSSRKSNEEKKPFRIPPPHQGGDGSSIEVVKRPRGRPPGSKNKPKPPVVITKEPETSAAMRPHVLEIPVGHDILDCLSQFSRRRKMGICVLAGSGSVANVTLRQPSPGAVIAFHGRFEILSISATFLSPAMPAFEGAGMAISLAGPHGQIIGGTVVGPLVAAGPVILVAAAFWNPSFHRLPLEDEVSASGGEANTPSPENEDEQKHHRHHHMYQHPSHSADPTLHPPASSAAAESCGMPIYGSHFSPDILWPAASRPPPPPPY